MADDKFKFGALKEKVQRLKRELPLALAKQAENYFTDSWSRQGFDGQPWKDVKRHDTSEAAYKYPIALRTRKLSSPILVGVYRGRSGGQLRRAVSRSVRQVSFEKIRLVVDLPYAKAQNDGNPGHNVPARPFMGQSKELTAMQRQKIREFMDGLWGK